MPRGPPRRRRRSEGGGRDVRAKVAPHERVATVPMLTRAENCEAQPMGGDVYLWVRTVAQQGPLLWPRITRLRTE